MSNYFGLLANKDSLDLFVNNDLYNINNLFDFDAASREVNNYKYKSIRSIAKEKYSGNLSDNDDDNSLFSETISFAKDINNKEPSEEEDKVTRGNSILL